MVEQSIDTPTGAEEVVEQINPDSLTETLLKLVEIKKLIIKGEGVSWNGISAYLRPFVEAEERADLQLDRVMLIIDVLHARIDGQIKEARGLRPKTLRPVDGVQNFEFHQIGWIKVRQDTISNNFMWEHIH